MIIHLHLIKSPQKGLLLLSYLNHIYKNSVELKHYYKTKHVFF